MTEAKRTLLIENSLHDIELIMAALEECHIFTEVDVVHDGEQAIDYLFRQKILPGEKATRWLSCLI
ncbi:MAG: hypothetical protein WKF30_17705 [Pyrinomonadaceae bacterium]